MNEFSNHFEAGEAYRSPVRGHIPSPGPYRPPGPPDAPPAAGNGRARAPRSAADSPGPEEVDIRDVLTTPAEALLPALRPLRALVEECRDDPALFNREILGRTLWSKQIEVCGAVARSPVTLVPAGRAVGKSFLLAGLALWWLYTRPGSLVITTAPDHRQVTSVLWKEIRRLLRSRHRGEPRPGSMIRLGYDHLSRGYGSPQQLVVDGSAAWQALGFSAQYEEGFSGQHAGELLVIVDEASGVSDEIWSAIHGLAAARLVVAGNPIRYDCQFRQLHDLAQEGSATIATVPISSLESPHADLESSPLGLASRSFLNQMREIHGELSPWWQANILGRFPDQDSTRFIPLAWIDACIRPEIQSDPRWIEAPAGSAFMGVDVGGGVGADRSVICVRDARRILEIFASSDHGILDDARQRLEPEVVRLARKWHVPSDHVVYDAAGIGRRFGSYLEREGLQGTVGYHGAGDGGRLYANRRTANAFAIKRRLDPHCKGHVPFYCGGILHWPDLRRELAELRGPTMTMEEGKVKQTLETKASLTARLHASPDLLDAFLMSFTFRD